MVQRSAPQQVVAERYFPERVRVAVPPGGFGNLMSAWLDEHAGKAGTSRPHKPVPGFKTLRYSISSMRRSRRPLLIASRVG
jgi:hypothetical protein